MNEDEKNNSRVLTKGQYPAHFDFEQLRREYIADLGELSGDVWTDHNLHDPGITIMEMLIYALIDLGYRTRLPIETLLARKQPDSPDDNFFTPAQILTNNPLTINDYRKLLIDTPGVKNAWLEINNEQELGIRLQRDTNDGQRAVELTCDVRGSRIVLNGLYDVFLELEPEILEDPSEEKKLLDLLRLKLHAHRNLCEDFVTLFVLCREEIGFCGEIEIEADANAFDVNLRIFLALQDFLSPRIPFYTLGQALELGDPIETIFEGRPWFNQSCGFIRTVDLEQSVRRKEIHLSDIYAVIGEVEGVRSVDKLILKSRAEGKDHVFKHSDDCDYFIHHLAENHTPVFSQSLTCFDFLKENAGRVVVDKKLTRIRFEESIRVNKKYRPNELLDKAIPNGNFDEELDDYYSIQNEFPRVYGIGEGGTPESASKQRKAQALQLKGYLLFYDEILANFLSQLSHLRELFSFSPEKDATYFTNDLESVPDIEKLLNFYTGALEKEGQWMAECPFAIPVPVESDQEDSPVRAAQVHYLSIEERAIVISRLRQEFMQTQYRIEVIPDECGYIFTIHINDLNILLQSKQIYKDETGARIAAQVLSFIATLETAYRLLNNYDDEEFSFEMIFTPVDYLKYLQTLIEDPFRFVDRRNEFLDHLLARFAETYSDFALLHYGSSGELEEQPLQRRKDELKLKADFLTHYPEIGRNRGKGYDYRLDGWDTGNISGFEKRVMALAGFDQRNRHSLCTFEVARYDDEYQVILAGEKSGMSFVSVNSFKSESRAMEVGKELMDALTTGSFYPDDHNEDHSYGIRLRSISHEAICSDTFSEKEHREAAIRQLKQLISGPDPEECIRVVSTAWRLQLTDLSGRPLKSSRRKYTLEQEAIQDLRHFTGQINQQLWETEERQRFEFIEAAKPGWVVNVSSDAVEPAITEQFRWTIGREGAAIQSIETYSTLEEAWNGLERIHQWPADQLILRETDKNELVVFHGTIPLAELMHPPVDKAGREFLSRFFSGGVGAEWIHRISNAHGWELWDDGTTLLQSHLLFDDPRKAELSATRIKRVAGDPGNFSVIGLSDNAFQLILSDKNGEVARSAEVLISEEEARDLETRIRDVWASHEVVITEGEEGFQYLIPETGQKKGRILQSYHVYRNLREAFMGIGETLRVAGRKSAYALTGDDANLNFSFVLKGKGGSYLAQHARSYSTAQARDKALQAIRNGIDGITTPYHIRKEYLAILRDENGEELLRAVDGLTDQQEARDAYHHLIGTAAFPEFYRKETVEYSHYLDLLNPEGNRIAYYPRDYTEWNRGDEIITRINAITRKSVFHITAEEFPDKYTFEWKGIGPTGAWEPLGRAEHEFSSFAETSKAMVAFDRSLPRWEINKEGEGSTLSIVDKQNPKAKVGVLHGEASEKYLRDYQKKLSDIRSDFTEEIKARISERPGVEGGPYVFRLVRHDQPLAIHPCQCFDEPSGEVIDEFFERALSHCTYPEFCQGGDIIICLEDGYHYVIKDRHNEKIYLIGYETYSTEEEALKAFNINYLWIIHYASDRTSYGDDPNDKDLRILTREGLVTPCPDATNILAYIPEAGGSGLTPDQLTELFCSYPVRIRITETADCNAPSICYYFHLLCGSRNKDCKQDWISTDFYQTPAEARTNFILFINLLRFKGSYAFLFNEETCCYDLIIREILLESIGGYDTEDLAWEGLDELLQKVCIGKDFHRIWDDVVCRYSILAIDPTYILAVHPETFYQKEKAEQVTEELHAKCYLKRIVHHHVGVEEQEGRNDRFHFRIDDEEEHPLWQGSEIFDSADEARDAGWRALDYAREPGFYGTDARENILLYTDDRQYSRKEQRMPVARYIGNGQEDPADFLELRTRLVAQTRHFPFYKDAGGYTFKLYCEELAGTPSTVIVPVVKDKVRIEDELSSGLVWHSDRHYGSLGEMQEAFDRFCELLEQRDSYEIEAIESCQRYRIILREKRSILGYHPQRYAHTCDADDAITRILSCLHNDGFHLIEHILLRPDPEDCECLLPVKPDATCAIPLPDQETDPCTLSTRPGGYVPVINRLERLDVIPEEAGQPVYIPFTDPYSFWASVILPCWTKTNRKLEYREAFQKLLVRESPAHVALNVHWISPRQMCDLEGKYKRWIRWKSCKPLCDHGRVVCDLIDCLGKLESCIPEIEEDLPGCECEHTVAVNAARLQINYLFHQNADRQYSEAYLKLLYGGISTNLTVSRENYQSLFDIRLPDENPVAEELEQEINEADLVRLLRKRKNSYVTRLQAIEDRRYRESENYERAGLFLKGRADEKSYLQLMEQLSAGLQRITSEEGRTWYVETMGVITGYYLDHRVSGQPDADLRTVKDALKQMTREDPSLLGMIERIWSPEELKPVIPGKILQTYRSLFKK